MSNTSVGASTSDVAGGGAGANAPSPVAGDMAAPDFDEDDVKGKPFIIIAGCLFIAAVAIGAIILLAWRGLQCGV